MKWKYTGNRKRLFGKWCYNGTIIDNNIKPPGDWVLLDGLQDKEKPLEKVVDEDKVIEDIRKELSKLKMDDLREIGYEYDARDTSKKELVEEIIQAKKERGEI